MSVPCCNFRSPLFRVALVVFLFGALIAAGFMKALVSVPRFYAERMAEKKETLAVDGEALQRQAERWSQDVSRNGDWQIEFNEEQINGWLATELLKRLPRSLPPDVYDPRIVIEQDSARIAAQYTKGNLTAVLSLEVAPTLTDVENEIAVRIRSAKIGSVPGLIDKARNSIRYAAMRSRIPLRWRKDEGDWVAKFRFDGTVFDLPKQVVLRDLELREGTLYLRGETHVPPSVIALPPIIAAMQTP